jgi:hypothetical protein
MQSVLCADMAALYIFEPQKAVLLHVKLKRKKKPAVYKHLLGYHWLLFLALPYLLVSIYMLDVLTGKSYPQFKQCA